MTDTSSRKLESKIDNKLISKGIKIYVKDYVECPTCKSPDTKILKENRISFLICEACGAKSTLKGKYA